MKHFAILMASEPENPERYFETFVLTTGFKNKKALTLWFERKKGLTAKIYNMFTAKNIIEAREKFRYFRQTCAENIWQSQLDDAMESMCV